MTKTCTCCKTDLCVATICAVGNVTMTDDGFYLECPFCSSTLLMQRKKWKEWRTYYYDVRTGKETLKEAHKLMLEVEAEEREAQPKTVKWRQWNGSTAQRS